MLPGMDIAAITGSLSSLFKSELGGVLLNIFRTLLEFFSPVSYTHLTLPTILRV